MLSTVVPLDLSTNLLWRAFIRRAGDRSRRARQQIVERCKHDFDFHVNSFVWQYNPAKVGNETGPFILRPVQSRVIATTAKRMFNPHGLRLDTTWEKSREEGASWLALQLFDHRSLYWTRQKFLCVSHSEKAVDNGPDPDALFWKIDFMHEHMPEWITGEIERSKMKFWFRNTKSAITGAASTGRSGVGGRATGVLLDELAKQREAAAIIGQTADTGPRLMVSSHYSSGTEFYRQTRRPDIHKEIIHWTDNPEKNPGMYRWNEDTNTIEVKDPNYVFPPDYPFVRAALPSGGPMKGWRSPWYDNECVRRQSPRDVSSHIDIDPDGSGHQFFDGPTINRLVRESAVPPVWEGDIIIDAIDGEPLELEQRQGGPLQLWLHPKRGGIPRGRYGMGGDISAGVGATPSCLCIADADLGTKVAQFQNAWLSPEAFAPYAAALGRFFRDFDDQEAYFAWEMAGGVGAAFGKKFMSLGYGRVYYRETPMQFAGLRESTDTPGWYPRDDAVRVLMENYRTALGLGTFINPSEDALLDTLKFVHTATQQIKHSGEIGTDDPTLRRHNHGDQVLADALACYMCELLGGRRPIRETERPPPIGSFAWRFAQGQKADRDRDDGWEE